MNILDKRFKYTPSYETDLRKRFRKVQADIKAKAEEAERNQVEAQTKTISLKARKA